MLTFKGFNKVFIKWNFDSVRSPLIANSNLVIYFIICASIGSFL